MERIFDRRHRAVFPALEIAERLGATAGEEHVAESGRRQLGQALGELDGHGVAHAPDSGERQLGHLGGGRRGQLLAVGVAELRAEQRGEGVEVPVAVGVEHIWALAALEHEDRLAVRSERAIAGEVHEEVLVSDLLQVHQCIHGCARFAWDGL